MHKRDVRLFSDDWGCTCPSQDRLQTFIGAAIMRMSLTLRRTVCMTLFISPHRIDPAGGQYYLLVHDGKEISIENFRVPVRIKKDGLKVIIM